MELEAAPPPVLGDRVQLQQVLLNLIMNGMEAMNSVSDRPRVLMLQSHAGASGLEVTVQDSGTGLDPRHVPHLFDTFFTTKTTGMGMGFPSAARSLRLTVAAFGPALIALLKGRPSTFPCLLLRRHSHERESSHCVCRGR